jgi:DNA-directed RNA polymerase specialized sigma24 family protein
VQAHLPLLTAYSLSRRFRPWYVEPDDFRSDLVAMVLAAHDTFRHINDPEVMVCPHCDRRGCSTWLGWRARKTASNHHRRRLQDEASIDRWAPMGDASTLASHNDSPQRMQAQAQVQQLLDRATPDQRAALVSKLEEWTGDDVWRELGISMGGRNYRLQRLVQTLTPDP